MRSVPTFLQRDQATFGIPERETLSRLAIRLRVRSASAQTARAHQESMARGAVPNSSCPSRRRRAQQFRQLQNRCFAILSEFASPLRKPVKAKPAAKSAQLIESRLWPARISSISALNLSMLGSAISFPRMAARFKAAAGSL